MKKVKMFFGTTALAVALIGAIATKASIKVQPYYYYNTTTGVWVLVNQNTLCEEENPIQCTYAATGFPIYADATFDHPLRRPATLK